MANTIIPAFNMNHHVHGMLPGTTTIPLLCNICPKKPVFSDTSHLLTHVASKGHLSCYYKMRVKASADPISKSLIDEYDDWYELWHVEDLMMERMNQKERKKSIADANANGHNATNSRRGSGGESPCFDCFHFAFGCPFADHDPFQRTQLRLPEAHQIRPASCSAELEPSAKGLSIRSWASRSK